MGHCDKTFGSCKCRDGFYGSACQYSRCPRSMTAGGGSPGEECSANGRCMTIKEAATEYNQVTLHYEAAYTHWDANMIQGCVCDAGWTGADCSLRTCPFGDDPGSTSQAKEIQLIQCLATSGSFTVTFRGRTTAAINYNANAATITSALEAIATIVDVTVALDGGSVACDSNGVTIKVTFEKNSGDLPPMILTNALSSTNTLLLKENGAASGYNSGISSVRGTTDSIECSNRGVCDRATGVCTCHKNWASSNGAGAVGTIPDCGYLTTGSPACLQVGALGGNECGGGHATCVTGGGVGYCQACDAGYTDDCSRKTCPTARAWFMEATADNTAHSLIECGGMGACDRTTGVCKCMTLGAYTLSSNSVFDGANCDKLSCPYNITDGAVCGNKGVCLSMSQWAAKSTNPQGTVLGLSYAGSTSAASWDAGVVQGCFCDYQPESLAPYASQLYTGPLSWGSYPLRSYDCSKSTCPVGDNPDTRDGAFEVQNIVCDATSGTFTLTFRGFTTAAISYNAVALTSNENTGSSAGTGVGESLQAKLQALFTINTQCYAGTCLGVNVAYSSGTSACKAGGGNTISLTFKTELGDLPILAATELGSGLGGTGTITVVEGTRGTKEIDFCSNHGVCDYDEGRCLCHKGYTSSDGDGNAGQRNDCGFKTMFAKKDAAAQRYQGGIGSLVTQTTSFSANTQSAL